MPDEENVFLEQANFATEKEVLRERLVDPNYPKTELEWFASRLVAELEEKLAAALYPF